MNINKSVILLYSFLPFLIAYFLFIFNFDKVNLLFLVFGVILLTSYVLYKTPINKFFLSSFIGAVLIFILSIPFWFPLTNEVIPSEKNEAIYSFSKAKKNPNTFAAWWNYYVQEVVKTNAVIHQEDPLKKLPHILVSNASVNYHEGVISINSLGFKGRLIPKNKENSFRIVILGDSVTFGQNVFKNSQPWAEVLQNLIDEKLNCNCEVQILNFGVNTYHLKDGVELLSRSIDWIKPDVVLSNFGWNYLNTDLGINSKFLLNQIPLNNCDLKSTSRAQFVWLQIQSKIHFFMTTLYNAVVVEKILNFFRNTVEDEQKILEETKGSIYYKSYEKLIDLLKTYNSLLFLISFNSAVTVDSPVEAIQFYQIAFPDVRSTIQLIGYHNKMIKKLSETHKNVCYIDSSNNILGKYDDDIFLDIVHFTPKGDRRMAHSIFQSLLPTLTNHPRLRCVLKSNP